MSAGEGVSAEEGVEAEAEAGGRRLVRVLVIGIGIGIADGFDINMVIRIIIGIHINCYQ